MGRKERLMQRCTALLEPWRNAMSLSWSQVSLRPTAWVPAPAPPQEISCKLVLHQGTNWPQWAFTFPLPLLPDIVYNLGNKYLQEQGNIFLFFSFSFILLYCVVFLDSFYIIVIVIFILTVLHCWPYDVNTLWISFTLRERSVDSHL